MESRWPVNSPATPNKFPCRALSFDSMRPSTFQEWFCGDQAKHVLGTKTQSWNGHEREPQQFSGARLGPRNGMGVRSHRSQTQQQFNHQRYLPINSQESGAVISAVDTCRCWGKSEILRLQSTLKVNLSWPKFFQFQNTFIPRLHTENILFAYICYLRSIVNSSGLPKHQGLRFRFLRCRIFTKSIWYWRGGNEDYTAWSILEWK